MGLSETALEKWAQSKSESESESESGPESPTYYVSNAMQAVTSTYSTNRVTFIHGSLQLCEGSNA